MDRFIEEPYKHVYLNTIIFLSLSLYFMLLIFDVAFSLKKFLAMSFLLVLCTYS